MSICTFGRNDGTNTTSVCNDHGSGLHKCRRSAPLKMKQLYYFHIVFYNGSDHWYGRVTITLLSVTIFRHKSSIRHPPVVKPVQYIVHKASLRYGRWHVILEVSIYDSVMCYTWLKYCSLQTKRYSVNVNIQDASGDQKG